MFRLLVKPTLLVSRVALGSPRPISSLLVPQLRSLVPRQIPLAGPLVTPIRLMNRNARRPKTPNHGKRPVSHARRRLKAKMSRSRSLKEKLFGFW